MQKNRKIIAFLLVALAIASAFPATRVRADSYQDLLKQQEQLAQQINDNRSTITNLQNKIQALDAKIAQTQVSAAQAARAVQTGNMTNSLVNEIFSATSLSTLIQRLVSINMIISATNQQAISLKNEKDQETQALKQMTAAQIQLDQQAQSIKGSMSSYDTEVSSLSDSQVAQQQPSFTPSAPPIANFTISEDQARANIVARESGGNYQAQNGRYYGAYQLDIN
jgi:peptidoglycan hydrolase CwlO-like protein